MKPYYDHSGVTIYNGSCLAVLPTLADSSIDAVVTDPPYPEIDRPYGRMDEAQWHEMMHAVVLEVRRVLKPSGSAVFILQANSERVGRMRNWLWEFQAWIGNEWGIVQDAYWHNPQAVPTVHCQRVNGLMRPSLKACVWAGPEDCYRNQDEVLIEPAEATKSDKRIDDSRLTYSTAGHAMRKSRALQLCKERGGATPLNFLTVGRGGGHGHGAATPLELCDWWVRYISPPGGVVLDPFAGSGTVMVAARNCGRAAIGIEAEKSYAEIAANRLAQGTLFAPEPSSPVEQTPALFLGEM